MRGNAWPPWMAPRWFTAVLARSPNGLTLPEVKSTEEPPSTCPACANGLQKLDKPDRPLLRRVLRARDPHEGAMPVFRRRTPASGTSGLARPLPEQEEGKKKKKFHFAQLLGWGLMTAKTGNGMVARFGRRCHYGL